MSRYDFREFSARLEGQELHVDGDQMRRIRNENPELSEQQIADVVDALNWDRIADPVGTTRVHPSGRAVAVRVADPRSPWEVIHVEGRGGSTCVGEYQKWPEYMPHEAARGIESVLCQLGLVYTIHEDDEGGLRVSLPEQTIGLPGQ